ncbi:MAG: hypothetical protein Q4G03_04830 [Planctomycetia bacterium]|nr:hypothetical protein [Planctomycetia bacterium]
MTNRALYTRTERRHARERATRTLCYALVCASLLSVALANVAVRAQSIINQTPQNHNEKRESFSAKDNAPHASAPMNVQRANANAIALRQYGATENLTYGRFDVTRTEQATLSAPTGVSKSVNQAELRVPYFFPQGADVDAADAIELLCSNDQGLTWYSYAVARAQDANALDNKTAFLFQAPAPGEYWFVLKTHFNNGKIAYSSTRGYSFDFQDDALTSPEPLATTQQTGTLAPTEPLDSLALDDTLALEPEDPQTPNDADPFLIGNAAYVDQESVATNAPTAPEEDNASFTLNDDAEELALEQANEQPQKGAVESNQTPWPGKLKTLSFGKEDGTEKLMTLVRWFTPNDLEPEFRITIKSLSIETAPTAEGPWTIVGQDLAVDQSGYGWIATAEQMKPFYVRTVAIDSSGNIWRDVSPQPLDVNAEGMRSALGAVKTPAPFASDEEKASQKSDSNKTEDRDDLTLIPNTGSEDAQNLTPRVASKEDDTLQPATHSRTKRLSDDASETSATKRAQSVATRRERPYVPAPTNPNQFQVNPLFTRGVDVLYRASQARPDVEPTSGKRSLFTPPNRARRVSNIRPAERRLSSEQLLAQRQKQMQEKLQYEREHEMENFEQKPELMEGRVFYMDSNGNLTTTPPEEMRQALNGYNSIQGNIDWSQAQPINSAGNYALPGSDSGVYMPHDMEQYDSSARSGAAIMSNNPYPNTNQSTVSPLNERYSNGNENYAPSTQTPYNNNNTETYRAVPQTSYSNPYYVAPNNEPVALPPKPSVTR